MKETCCLLGLIIIKRPKNMHVSLRLCRNNISHIFPTKNWPGSLERGMLLVRRARRWALRKLICKIWRHGDSKTISWHAAFPVRFARLLAALRLNSPLRGSDSGSLGRQHRKPHDGSLATVRAICFRIHHGCIILRTMFYNAVRLHIAKSSWPVSECLNEKLSKAKIQNIKKQK